jgi:hypothetical protein
MRIEKDGLGELILPDDSEEDTGERCGLKYICGHWPVENQLHWMQGKIVSGRRILHHLRKMKMEKKRVSAKRHMMHAALDSDFMYEALFSE